MRESYCGLCDQCQLGSPEFLEAVARLKDYVDRFRVQWWSHCFPGDEGFSLPEFRRGLEWFLNHVECPGCKGGRGLARCAVRRCAADRKLSHCYECPDLGPCDKFKLILTEFPDQKIRLQRRRLKRQAQDFNNRKT